MYIILIVTDGTEEYSTCTECEEEELDLLALWEQLNEVKLKRDHVNAVLTGRGFSCTNTGNTSTIHFVFEIKQNADLSIMEALIIDFDGMIIVMQ